MPIYDVSIDATMAPPPMVDGVVLRPPIFFHSIGIQHEIENGTDVDGQYSQPGNRSQGSGGPKPQDTYISGTGGMTGTAFTVISGTWTDAKVNPLTGKHELSMEDGTSGTVFSVEEAGAIAGGELQCRQYMIYRGYPATAATKTAAEYYAYLEFGINSTSGRYRIRMAYGEPLALQYIGPNDSAWKTVQTEQTVGRTEDYFEANGNKIKIKAEPSYLTGTMSIEIGGMGYFRHTPPRPEQQKVYNNPNDPPELPNDNRVSLYGKNGYINLSVLPLRYKALTVTRAPKKPVGDLSSVESATIITNATHTTSSNQVTSGSLTTGSDGKTNIVLEASLPDAGDGLGSETPPFIADAIVSVPPRFAYYCPVGTGFHAPRVVKFSHHEVWDESRHFGYADGAITLQNYDGTYNGEGGRRNWALDLSFGNGYSFGRQVRGIAGIGQNGWTRYGNDTVSLASAKYADNTHKLRIPLGTELVFDGFHIMTAMRTLASFAYLPEFNAIPNYGVPPYSDYTPGPILGKGTGLSPRYRYTPEMSVLDCMLDIIHDQGLLPYGNASTFSIPYYLYQTTDGLIHCDPWWGYGLLPVKHYMSRPPYAYDPYTVAHISKIEVMTGTTQLRTEAVLQGLDPWTNELLHAYEPFPWNLDRVGYRYPVMERAARFCSQAAIENAMDVMRSQASLSDEYVSIEAPADPNVHAGNAILVTDYTKLGKTDLYYIVDIVNNVGLKDASQRNGEMDCTSMILARNMLAAVPY